MGSPGLGCCARFGSVAGGAVPVAVKSATAARARRRASTVRGSSASQRFGETDLARFREGLLCRCPDMASNMNERGQRSNKAKADEIACGLTGPRSSFTFAPSHQAETLLAGTWVLLDATPATAKRVRCVILMPGQLVYARRHELDERA